MAKKKQKKQVKVLSKKVTKKPSLSRKTDLKDLKKVNAPITPMGDRVLIKELGEEEMFKTSASGIIIPDNGKDEGGKRGNVVAVGPGKYDDGDLIPMRVKIGQTVLYTWGDKIKIKDEEYVIVRESEIIAILN